MSDSLFDKRAAPGEQIVRLGIRPEEPTAVEIAEALEGFGPVMYESRSIRLVVGIKGVGPIASGEVAAILHDVGGEANGLAAE